MQSQFSAIQRTLGAMAVSCLWAASAGAENLVVEFQATGNKTTAEFEVRAPWILDWRINSDYNKMIAFDLDLVDARTGILKGNVLRVKRLGNGVRMFNEGGRYRLRVNASFTRWHLKIIELTPEEAELYTPSTPR